MHTPREHRSSGPPLWEGFGIPSLMIPVFFLLLSELKEKFSTEEAADTERKESLLARSLALAVSVLVSFTWGWGVSGVQLLSQYSIFGSCSCRDLVRSSYSSYYGSSGRRRTEKGSLKMSNKSLKMNIKGGYRN